MAADEGIRRKSEDLNRQLGGARNLKGEPINIENWVDEKVTGQPLGRFEWKVQQDPLDTSREFYLSKLGNFNAVVELDPYLNIFTYKLFGEQDCLEQGLCKNIPEGKEKAERLLIEKYNDQTDLLRSYTAYETWEWFVGGKTPEEFLADNPDCETPIEAISDFVRELNCFLSSNYTEEQLKIVEISLLEYIEEDNERKAKKLPPGTLRIVTSHMEDQIAAGVIQNACRCDCTGEVKCFRQPDDTWIAKCEDCGEVGPAQVNWWTAAHHYPYEAKHMKNRESIREMQGGWALAEPETMGRRGIRDRIETLKDLPCNRAKTNKEQVR